MRVAQVLGKKKLFLLPFALLYVCALLLLSRIIRVNIHPIVNGRLGHFAFNTEMSVLRIKEMEKRSKWRNLNIGCATSIESCNLALEKMWKREFNFKTGEWGCLLNDISERTQRKNFYQKSRSIDIDGQLISFPPNLTFDHNEKAIGEEFLAHKGISDPSKIVCLNVRDSSFLSNSEPRGWSKSRDWSYHDYRNSKISTYIAAAEKLAEMGYTVFRMGAIVANPLKSMHPKVIDYATNGMRTEFLDIFLGANCTFCVSTGSGWDSIPQIFRRPSLYVNLLPVFLNECVVRDLLIYPKILQDRVTKDTLRLTEIIERDNQTEYATQGYANAGVESRDMNSAELVEAVTEMAARVEGTFIETPAQKQMQSKLNHIFSTHPKLQPTPNYYPIRSEFASCFLSNYPNFLD
jgi:putative glycosyltransferase (TIGR04372 family)